MDGEVRKFQFRALTIDDSLAKDGLEAVGTLYGKEPCYLVGGVASQSYLPTSCRRPTSDIDLSVVRPLNYADFKEFVKPVKECLGDKGYDVSEKKHSRAFKLDIQNPEVPDERLLIEFSRRNQKSFDANKKKLQRELENSKAKILEGRSSTYLVCTPEDIVVPKMVRSVGALKRNPSFKSYLPLSIQSLSDRKISERLGLIANLRDEAVLSPADLDLAEKLRFVSDLYDMRILPEIAGINQVYFFTAYSDWNVVNENSDESRNLINSLFPFISKG